MKRLFTNLLKYQVMLLSVGFFMTGSINMSAEEYKSIIRYDRVWEHVSYYFGEREVFHVKFDGCEEINGKTYHRLTAFRKASYNYNMDGQPYIFDIDIEYNHPEGYLREEDGKVYTLIIKYGSDSEDPFVDLYTANDDDPKSYEIEERLIYDFTCKEGESYKGLHIESGIVEEMEYTVKSVDYVVIDGEEHKRLWISPETEIWVNPVIEPIIEGVGIGNQGCLTTMNFIFISTCPCTHHIFNRLLSTNGNMLYYNHYDYTNFPYADFSGIDHLTAHSRETDTPSYDMMGRRISSPAPGQLYIRDGKKYIGK